MKQSKFLYVVAILSIFFTIFMVANKLLKRLQHRGKGASSIGIIGGADGPTAIYVSSTNPLVLAVLKLSALFVRPLTPILLRFFS